MSAAGRLSEAGSVGLHFSADAFRKCNESFFGQSSALDCGERPSSASWSGLTGVKAECDGLEEALKGPPAGPTPLQLCGKSLVQIDSARAAD